MERQKQIEQLKERENERRRIDSENVATFEAIVREVKSKWNPVVHSRNHDDEVEEDGDDSYKDEGVEEDYKETNENRKTRVDAYIPLKNSSLSESPEAIENEVMDVKSRTGHEVRKGKKLISSKEDPLSRSSMPNPDRWYASNISCYVFMPFLQYSCIKCRYCPFCDHKGEGIQKKSNKWRPMITLGRIVWVLHERCKHEKCP